VSTARESEPASNAHRLSTKDGRSGHDNKIKRANEGNSRPVEHNGSEKSAEKEGQWATGTHSLCHGLWREGGRNKSG